MDTLWQDIRYGLRQLARQPGFTVVAVLTLALGIGANTALFSVVNAVLLRALPYSEPTRLVQIDEVGDRGRIGVSPPNFLDFRAQNRAFEQMAAYTGTSYILTGGAEPLRVEGLQASPELFASLRASPLAGRLFLPGDDEPGRELVAVIGHGLWQRAFGGGLGIIGRRISLDDKPYTVVGVMPPGFEFPLQPSRVEIWTPLTFAEAGIVQAGPTRFFDVSHLRGAHYLDLIGRLKPGVSPQAARADLERIAAPLAKQYPNLVPGRVMVVPLKQEVVGTVRSPMWILASAVALLLLIALANVSGLLLARAAARRQEVAVRSALGASRSRLVRQLLTESLLLAVVGGAFGVVIAAWSLDALLALVPADVPRVAEVELNGWVLLFAFATSLVAGVLFGLAPAWQGSRSDLAQDLKQGGTCGRARQTLRKVLVATEVALALVLLCGAGLMVRTLGRLYEVNPGFDPHHVWVSEVVLSKTRYPEAAQQAAFFQQLLERLEQLPEVESVGATTNLPLSGTNMVFMGTLPEKPDSPAPVSYRAVSPGYFRTMRIPLRRGRWFDARDTAASRHVLVVNETMARQFWPHQDPLGHIVRHGFQEVAAEVVGVVGDVRYAGLEQETRPEMYAPFAQSPWPFFRLTVRTRAQPEALTAAARAQLQALDNALTLDRANTLEGIISASVAYRRFLMLLLGTFAALALALVAVGIYGVISFVVAQQQREVGLRMALGAQPRDILGLVVGQGLRLSLLGIGIGLAGAWALTRLLRGLLFEVSPTDPLTFAGVSVLLAAVALVACYVPARRATRVDPMTALRYE